MALVGRAYGGAPLNGCNSLDPPRGRPRWCLIYWT